MVSESFLVYRNEYLLSLSCLNTKLNLMSNLKECVFLIERCEQQHLLFVCGFYKTYLCGLTPEKGDDDVEFWGNVEQKKYG